jgi:hypothetical protein
MACGSNLISDLSKYFGHQQFKSDLQRQATEAVLKSEYKHYIIPPEINKITVGELEKM